jgi:hypothetical protein
MEECDNSTIRQFDNGKKGMMESWSETYQVCKTCEVFLKV